MFRLPGNHVTGLIAAVCFASAILACGGDDKDAIPPDSSPSTSPVSEATLPPDPTPTLPASALPTVTAPELKLRVIEVASGAVRDLPVGFGRTSAWAQDSSQVAVAGEGLAVGEPDGSAFSLFWPSQCYDVEWSPTQDIVAAACADGLVVFDAGGRLLARDDVAPLDWSRQLPWLHWSFDGHSIAYGPTAAPIRILRNDGAKQRIEGQFTGAQWLANGRLASFEQPTYRDAAVVRVHDPASGNVVVAQASTPAGANGVGVDPTGRFMAFSIYGEVAAPGTRILPSTVSVVRLSDGGTGATFPAYGSNYNAFGFTPDGQSLLVQTDVCGPNWSLIAAGIDGSTRTIARGGFMATKFSPDGRRVGFTRGTELWEVAADGATPARRLAEAVHGPAGFEWSPDSKWISVPPFFGGFGQCP